MLLSAAAQRDFLPFFPSPGWSDAPGLVQRLSRALLAAAAISLGVTTGDGRTPANAAPVRADFGAFAIPVPVAPAWSGPARSAHEPGPEAPARKRALSMGRPNRGTLVNGVRMVDGPEWTIVNPERAFGTEETIASLVRAIGAVNQAFPNTPKLYVGDISAEGGGAIRPHRSHQSGRDVDLGLYYTKGPAWFVRARAENLDRARSWELVKALVGDPNVEMILVDRSIQRLLKDFAEKSGESRERLDALFDERSAFSDRLIRHEWGHLTHLHVRLKCPLAVDAAERMHRDLALAAPAHPRRPVSRVGGPG